MKVLLDINYSPNSIALWNLIKKKLKNKKIIVKGMSFNLIKSDDSDSDDESDSDSDDDDKEYTEADLINDFRKWHKKRLETDEV